MQFLTYNYDIQNVTFTCQLSLQRNIMCRASAGLAKVIGLLVAIHTDSMYIHTHTTYVRCTDTHTHNHIII